MKNIFILFLLIIIYQLSIINCRAQAGQWTWMKGDSIPNTLGYYGVQGVPSPLNEPPARYACGCWTDTAGNFWIYGGINPGITNGDNWADLWKFDITTTMWTWMNSDSLTSDYFTHQSKGVYSSSNKPGGFGYGMFTWVTKDNHLWLFGGDQGNLWQYDPSINEWAWMGFFGTLTYGTIGIADTTNMPGSRQEANSAWTDSAGNLWLFGGLYNLNNLEHNDMWEYDISSGIWTWMSGSSNANDAGSYSIIGQPSVNNYPSARSTNLFWKDESGNFWLAGGFQLTYSYLYQDVWKFNPQTLEWTWIKGPEGSDDSLMGTNCEADTMNESGPRYENRASWKICDDLIITYSGFNNDGIAAPINDLWAYKPNENEWVKINSWPIDSGHYGMQGINNAANHPAPRYGSVGFKDNNNNIWMFGGQNDNLYFNDLWKYTVDTTCVSCSQAVIVTALNNLTGANISVFPNPSVGNWQLAVSNELIGSRLEVYDDEGRLVFQSAIRNPKSEITLTGLSSGVYFLRISSANVSITKKLVKL